MVPLAWSATLFLMSLSDNIKNQARELGFDLVGIAPAAKAPQYRLGTHALVRDHDNRENG